VYNDFLGESDVPDDLLEQVLMLQGMLVSLSENGGINEGTYMQIRASLIQDETLKSFLPRYIRTSRDQGQLWGYLKSVATGSGSWVLRREHIYESFQPLLEFLECRNSSPADESVTAILANFDTESVHAIWVKALSRRHEDPDGAITLARSLLESVCKRIMDEMGEVYGGSDTLPQLYGKASKLLSLSPSQHTEEAFKAILGGCNAVVNNIATLRNKIGDAHGQGKSPVRPAPRHAALAVNLAGSMAMFLVETWLARQD